MNYDLVMLCILVGVTIWGMWHGAIWQIASLTSLIASAALAAKYGEALAPAFGNDPSWNRYVAMLVIYLVASMSIWLGFRFVRGIINRLRLQEFDHQIGGLIGLVKGGLLCMVITFFAVTLSASARQAVFSSYSGYYMSVALHRGVPLLPDAVRAKIGDLLDDFANNKLPQQPPGGKEAPPGASAPPVSGGLPAEKSGVALPLSADDLKKLRPDDLKRLEKPLRQFWNDNRQSPLPGR